MKFKFTFFVHLLIILVLIFSPVSYAVENAENQPASEQSENKDNPDTSESNENKELDLYAKSCILIERSTGRTAYEKNADEKMYPASTTKLLTAILAIEHCDLNDVVTITYDMTSRVPASYTTAYLRPGEKVTVEELLNVLLIPSANDAGFALAIHISGSVDEFAKLMNEKAAQIGCTNSNFTNPSGIHDVNHYSTARDMSKIGICAMNYPQIANIVCKTSYTLHENKYNARTFTTTNSLIKPAEKTYYEFATGMKTGFTQQAGSCLIASAKKENMEFLAVILDAPEPHANITYRDLDCKTLFEYGFENYEEITKIDEPVLSIDNLQNIIHTKFSMNLVLKISLIILTLLLIIVILKIKLNKNKNKSNSKGKTQKRKTKRK